MRILSKVLAAVALALLLAGAGGVWLAIDDAPSVPARDDVSLADVERAAALVRLQAKGRGAPGDLRWVSLQERDVDLLADHAARRVLGAHARVRLQRGAMQVQASVPLPAARWLNVDVRLRQTAALPEVERVRVGALPVPALLVRPLLGVVAARHGVEATARAALDDIERVTLGPGRVVVAYRLGPDTVQRLREAVVAPADRERLRAYHEQIVDLAGRLEGDEVSLVRLLPPLLAGAVERGRGGGDAVAETRAALLALTLYATRRPPTVLVAGAQAWPVARPLVVTLQQRHDLALHFVVSALLAAEAGTPLADAIGLWKEVDDARRAGGSGFSFADLAADRAGTRLGQLAVRDPARLQERLAQGIDEADLMPRTDDLPEDLPLDEFQRRFGGIGGAGYARIVATIEARLDALPVLQ